MEALFSISDYILFRPHILQVDDFSTDIITLPVSGNHVFNIDTVILVNELFTSSYKLKNNDKQTRHFVNVNQGEAS